MDFALTPPISIWDRMESFQGLGRIFLQSDSAQQRHGDDAERGCRK